VARKICSLENLRSSRTLIWLLPMKPVDSPAKMAPNFAG
jgi:hypothetical protein